MADSPRPQSVARFGTFEVDLQRGELRKNGLKLKLRDQPFRVLAALVQRPGEVVTREQLKDALWSKDTFVDFDSGLNAAVARLRDVLRDSAVSPRYIATVPRQGYRFVAPVERVSVPAPALQLGRRRLAWAAAAVAVAVIGGTAVWLLRSPRERPEALLTPVPLTSYPGEEWAPAFSPDGSEVAFHWNGENQDNWDVYVKQIGSDTRRRLTKDPGDDGAAAWSPDGRHIAFQHTLPSGKVAVMLIPSVGGPTRKIAETLGPSSRAVASYLVPPFLTWSSDGERLVVVDRDSRDEPFALFSLSVDGGERRRLTSPGSESRGDAGPVLSPDGRTLAFHRVFWHDRGDVYLLPVSEQLSPEGEPMRLPSENRFNTSPTWTAAGGDIVFCSSPAGRSAGLWRMRIHPSPGKPIQFRFVGPGVWHPALSRDGDRLAYARFSATSGLWRLRMGDTSGQNSLPQSLNPSTQTDVDPDYSPDGRRIACTSNRLGNSAIWVSGEDGSNLTR
ncbi:MAG: hypothetical protein GY953_25310, partial [bacterium]|nr:hypothetical protein [bacterium]